MPEYLSLLRNASVGSIYALFVFVIILFLFKGKIKDRTFVILYYVWLPIAVITQFLMTYFRLQLHQSNLLIMNIYLMLEFAIIIVVLLLAREQIKGIKTNYKIWGIVILFGILLHFIDDFNKIHNAAMLFIAIIYFQLTVSFIDLDRVEKFLTDPYSLLHISIFVKAFGYSYFLIYQTDYTFPLSIYSAVNLVVQILLGTTLFLYYKSQKKL
ncbi:MAG: hypothetical protein KDC52_13685 [Ignavibacteriae bacterium]|nr:hypothetical protein [Ignavibacteriota bacterium]